MGKINLWARYFICGLLCWSYRGGAEILLENSTGEMETVEIELTQPFIEVVDAINQSLQSMESDLDSNHLPTEGLWKVPLQRLRFEVILSGNRAFLVKASKKSPFSPRSYYTPLTPEEKNDLSFILRTLANNSLVKIKKAESSLKSAGERIDHIHPFNFLGAIFTDEELKVCVRNIQGRSWVWKSFLSGVTDTMTEEHAIGNVLPYAQDFANRLGINVNTILPSLQSGKWTKVVDILIDEVPRQGDSGRYGM